MTTTAVLSEPFGRVVKHRDAFGDSASMAAVAVRALTNVAKEFSAL